MHFKLLVLTRLQALMLIPINCPFPQGTHQTGKPSMTVILVWQSLIEYPPTHRLFNMLRTRITYNSPVSYLPLKIHPLVRLRAPIPTDL